MIKAVQIGYGYWGANIAKKLMDSSKFEFVALCEASSDRAERAKKALPEKVIISDRYEEYLDDKNVEAFIIATQTELSYDIAMKAMEKGKHIFIEKPIATTVERTLKLRDMAYKMNAILHCDHIMLYNPYYRYIKRMIDNGELGDLIYFDVSKLNLGPIRKDVNALMDLAVHDVAVIDYIMDGKEVKKLSAFGETPFGKQETLTYLTLKYDNFIAHIKSSWVSPIKVRQTMIAGTKKMVIFDDMSYDKVKIYNCGIDVIRGKEYGQYEFLNRTGDIYIPNIPFEDSLQNSLEYFENCVQTGQQSLSGPEPSLRVMKVLEWAQKELRTSSINPSPVLDYAAVTTDSFNS
jgi:predicted dehydrogenase